MPVLSTTSTSTFSNASIASAVFTSTPAFAPLPTATMMLIGVAKPSAHGQAMMSTLTAVMTASTGDTNSQITSARIATRITAGTNQSETVSTSFWIGTRDRWAWPTISTIFDSVVSRPVAATVMVKLPVVLSVPPVTASPGCLATGTGSPVIIDSSTRLSPLATSPSSGTLPPGLHADHVADLQPFDRHLFLPVSVTRNAVGGARSSSSRTAPLVCARARSSSNCPSRTSVTITAADSK